MLKINKDEMVIIISGNDIGKDCLVMRVDTATHKFVVEGCNVVTKHTKPGAGNPQGGIVKVEAAMDISNVMLLADGQPTKVGFKIEDGKKVRVAKKTGKVIA